MHAVRALAFASLTFFAAHAAAEPPPRDVLARDASAMRLWYLGWSGGYAALATGSTIVAFAASDPGLRADARVTAVTSGIGLMATALLFPPQLRSARCDPSESAEACDARVLAKLSSAADFERFGHSIWPHLGGALVNGGAALFLWLHEDRIPSAIAAAVLGTAICEVQIATQPTIARNAGHRPSPAVTPLKGGAAMSVSIPF